MVLEMEFGSFGGTETGVVLVNISNILTFQGGFFSGRISFDSISAI